MFVNPKCLQIISVVSWSSHEIAPTLPHGYWTIALKNIKSKKEETDYYCDFSYFSFGTENLSHSVSDFIFLLKIWFKV